MNKFRKKFRKVLNYNPRKYKDDALEQFLNELKQMNFTSDIVIELNRERLGWILSYRVDESSKRIAFFMMEFTPTFNLVNMANIIKVEYAQNNEVIGEINGFNTRFGSFGNVRQIPAISSVYLDFYTNDPQDPIKKCGVTFREPKPIDKSYTKHYLEWFNKVYASLQLLIPKYGAKADLE